MISLQSAARAKFGKFAIMLGASLIQTAPANAEAIELAPASNWVVHFDDSSCAIARDFGVQQSLVSLELRQFRPDDSFQMIVSTKAYPLQYGAIEVTLLPDAAQEYGRGFPVDRADGGHGYAFIGSLKPAADREIEERLDSEGRLVPVWPLVEQTAREQNVTGILIDEAFSEDLLLQTGPLDQVMNVMRTCMDDLVTSWGIDLLAHQTLSRPVQADDLSEWSRQLQRRYPSSMLQEGRQAIVWARMTVGIDGRGTQCAIQSTMNDAAFDEVACGLLLRHGRWHPALDANQRPIVSYWVGSIIYTMG